MYGLCEEVAAKSRQLIARQLALHGELAALGWWGAICARIKNFDDLRRELGMCGADIDAVCDAVAKKIADIHAQYTQQPEGVDDELQKIRHGAFAGLSCATGFAKMMLGDAGLSLAGEGARKVCEVRERRIVNAVLDLRTELLDAQILAAGTSAPAACQDLQNMACAFVRDMHVLHERLAALRAEDEMLRSELSWDELV